MIVRTLFEPPEPNQLVCDVTLREMPDGSWVFVMLGGGPTEPHPDNRVFLSQSLDVGATWTPLQQLDLGLGDEAQVVSHLMILGDRATLFVQSHNGGFGGWRAWMVHSDDLCHTWGPPEPMPGFLAERAFIRPQITTRPGRVLLPWQHYRHGDAAATDLKDGRFFHIARDSRNGVLVSEDGGATWTIHGDIRLSDDPTYHAWAEPTIVELSDGRIAMLIRADGKGCLYRADSTDGGLTWPEFAEPTDIPNPGSKATLLGLPDGRIALLHNPSIKGRLPLALWISDDDMQTWGHQQVLVEESLDGPNSGLGLSYPDGFVSRDGRSIHFVFDDNRHRAVYVEVALP
ncbi:MAG: glycoside hydrolase [Armatimonadetes bacterium]|nr:glycoside hydrolase [Armatimonadota bacterium]